MSGAAPLGCTVIHLGLFELGAIRFDQHFGFIKRPEANSGFKASTDPYGADWPRRGCTAPGFSEARVITVMTVDSVRPAIRGAVKNDETVGRFNAVSDGCR